MNEEQHVRLSPRQNSLHQVDKCTEIVVCVHVIGCPWQYAYIGQLPKSMVPVHKFEINSSYNLARCLGTNVKVN